jgi:type II secretory ATPase GspE/PulE/Tfp pilus assembly ATPase PilB-like protein
MLRSVSCSVLLATLAAVRVQLDGQLIQFLHHVQDLLLQLLLAVMALTVLEVGNQNLIQVIQISVSMLELGLSLCLSALRCLLALADSLSGREQRSCGCPAG